MTFERYPTGPGEFDEFKSPDITAWKLARAAIEHENNLVNHRMTWLMQSQAFLLSAFSLTFIGWSGRTFEEPVRSGIIWLLAVIALFGIYLCLIIQRSVQKALDALKNVTLHYNELQKELRSNRTPPLHVLRKPVLLFDQHDLPLAVAILWVLLVVFLALTQYPGTLGRITSQSVSLYLVAVAAFIAGLGFERVRRLRNKPNPNDAAYDKRR